MHQYKRRRRKSSVAGISLDRSLSSKIVHAPPRASPLTRNVTNATYLESLYTGKQGDFKFREGGIQDWATGISAWMFARSGDVKRLKNILDAQPSLVNKPNSGNITPLHYAAENGHTWCVGLLVERGAEYRVDDEGMTPAMLAFKNHRTDALALLLHHKKVPIDEAELLKAQAIHKNSHGMIAALSKYLDPRLGPVVPIIDETSARIASENAVSAIEAKLKRERPFTPDPAKFELPAPQEWTSRDVGRWLETTFELGGSLRNIQRAFEESNVTGKMLMSLKRKELQQLLQMLRMPPKYRAEIVASILDIHYNSDIEDCSSKEKREIALAIGSANYFVVKTMVEIALRTTLKATRQRLINAKAFSPLLPESFSFVTMRNKVVKRKQEEKMRLVDVGFMMILHPDE